MQGFKTVKMKIKPTVRSKMRIQGQEKVYAKCGHGGIEALTVNFQRGLLPYLSRRCREWTQRQELELGWIDLHFPSTSRAVRQHNFTKKTS